MKKLSVLCVALGMFFGAGLAAHQEKHIVVVVASYNNKQWYRANLDSVFTQKYDHYHVIYIDDCSTDGTGALVDEYIKKCGKEDRVTLIRNHERRGALENQYHAIHSCDDKSVVVILDGDDWFAYDGVLAHVNKIYSEFDVWLTYGQFKEYPSGAHGFCSPMPAHVVQNNAFRDHQSIPSHLRTFYAGLFKKIKKEDLMHEGKFLPMTGDIAAMFPMIEMARDHFKFIPEVLLTYNGANNLNDHKVSKGLQRKLDLLVRSRPRYAKLGTLF